nr:replication protein A 70 kDa DNA-binding subunit B [Tanacetum cinerariifolium]
MERQIKSESKSHSKKKTVKQSPGIGDVVAVNYIGSRKIRRINVIEDEEQETECVIYATVYRIQYKSGWTYIGCKIYSKKVVTLSSKAPSSSKAKQTWWCEKHESQDQVASRYKMIVRVMDESGSAQLCIFDGSMYKLSGYTA